MVSEKANHSSVWSEGEEVKQHCSISCSEGMRLGVAEAQRSEDRETGTRNCNPNPDSRDKILEP